MQHVPRKTLLAHLARGAARPRRGRGRTSRPPWSALEGRARQAAAATAAAAAVGLVGGGLWWRRNPSPCPYAQRLWVELPHPSVTRARLLEILDPRPAERMLEVGPGTGYYTLPVARRLAPGG